MSKNHKNLSSMTNIEDLGLVFGYLSLRRKIEFILGQIYICTHTHTRIDR